jgi:S-adenosylmethionine synthetase
MERNIIVTESDATWIEDRPVEIVERKGIGHPDSLCDGIAERISLEYTRWCRENLGAQLHHNFDKVQLVAGKVVVGFGQGHMLKPIRIQIAGRGTSVSPDGRSLPTDLIAINAAKAYLCKTLRYLDPDQHCIIDCFAGSGASQLIHVVEQVTANDTSFGVAHWPLSQLEQTVYDTTQYINEELINRFPIGEDVKVMGIRQVNEILLTCAVPFIAPQIANLGEYVKAKTAVQQSVQEYAEALNTRPVRVDLNMADNEAVDTVYLTLTGTSAECGDDGATGRGNRITGLITPFRATSLEATAGKNPISHAGKIYNVVALLAAQAIVEQVTAVRQVEVVVLSQIGRPLVQPLVATAAVSPASGILTPAITTEVMAVLDEHLANIGQIRHKIINGEVNLF